MEVHLRSAAVANVHTIFGPLDGPAVAGRGTGLELESVPGDPCFVGIREGTSKLQELLRYRSAYRPSQAKLRPTEIPPEPKRTRRIAR